MFFFFVSQRRDKRIAELERALSAFDVRVIWEIEDWPNARRKTFLQSHRFHLAKYAWYFGMYPNGDTDESKGWLSVYLFLDTESPLLRESSNTKRSTFWRIATGSYLNEVPSTLSLPKGKFINLEYALTFINHISPQDSLRKEFKATFPILKTGQGIVPHSHSHFLFYSLILILILLFLLSHFLSSLSRLSSLVSFSLSFFLSFSFSVTYVCFCVEGWGDRRAIRMSSITEEFGFLKNGTLRIEADITVKKQFWSI
jgi:hypothetical protein